MKTEEKNWYVNKHKIVEEKKNNGHQELLGHFLRLDTFRKRV